MAKPKQTVEPTADESGVTSRAAATANPKVLFMDLKKRCEEVLDELGPMLKQAATESTRLETQREGLKKSKEPEVVKVVLPQLLARIEEHARHTKRLSRSTRELNEMGTLVSQLDKQVQSQQERDASAVRDLESLGREERLLWARELTSLREKLRHLEGVEHDHEETIREFAALRQEAQDLPILKAKQEVLSKALEASKKDIASKAQIIQELRKVLSLMSGNASPAGAQDTALEGKPGAKIVSISGKPKEAAVMMFGSGTLEVGRGMIDQLLSDSNSPSLPAASPPQPTQTQGPVAPAVSPISHRPPPPPSGFSSLASNPNTLAISIDVVEDLIAQEAAPAAVAPSAPPPGRKALVPAPQSEATAKPPVRPGTLVVDDDMLSEMLYDETQDSRK